MIEPEHIAVAMKDARAAWLSDNSDTTLEHHIRVVATAVLQSLERQGYRFFREDGTP